MADLGSVWVSAAELRTRNLGFLSLLGMTVLEIGIGKKNEDEEE